MKTITLALAALLLMPMLSGLMQDETLAGPATPMPMQEAVQPVRDYLPIHQIITGAPGTKARIALGTAAAGIVANPADGFTLNIWSAAGVTWACSLKVVSRVPGVVGTWQWFRAGESFDYPIYGVDSVVVAKMTATPDTLRLWAWRR